MRIRWERRSGSKESDDGYVRRKLKSFKQVDEGM